uniref:Amino acid adenylation domain-containing protein n=1 Tax=Candidatus Kentrum sp. LPFa TaxID=2126335 RepID=A0A450W606_9GAMM|nr:MAG: amino acid adenylation domain-containing protein [Candidatus Kentron sp. LPFa]
MSALTELLRKLERRGIRLDPDGDRLRVRGARDALDAADTAALRARKAEIIALLREQEMPQEAPAPQPRPTELPLSFAQERLWFLARMESTADAYNLALALRLQGPISPNALAEALAVVVGRHEALRTDFPARDGAPRQRIMERVSLSIEPMDFGHLPESTRLDAARAALRERAARPFDLGCGPLVRATLVGLFAQDHILLLALHHIIADGWSLGVLTRELDVAYGAILAGTAPDLAPLELQYADYTLWQRRYAESAHWRGQLDWWQQKLQGAPTLLGLPTDHPRPPIQGSAGATVTMTLDDRLTARLERLGEQQGASLFMTLFALWSVLLARYSGEEEMVIGVPVANRHRPGLEPLMGCFINTLALRADLSDDPSFLDLLGRLRQTTLDAYARQDIPFERLVDALDIERSLSHGPLFQVLLSVEYAQSHPAARDYALGDLRVQWMDLGRDTTQFDLAMELVKTHDGLRGWLDYSTELFDASTIERMVGHFQMLAEGVVADPSRAISALPLLSEAERRRILTDWNPAEFAGSESADSEAEPASAKPEVCIQALFERQAARAPDAVALVVATPGTEPDQCASVTYAELDARANALARRLSALGPGADRGSAGALDSGALGPSLVGVCMGRSADLVVVILGILKAGYGYVPVDPNWPAQRIGAILAEARPFALVTEPGLLDAGLIGDSIPIHLDPAVGSLADPSANPPKSQPEDVAYVMFTSGSTGAPKGMIIEHRNVVGYVHAFVSWARLTAADRVLQHGTIAFDMSIEEIFPALSVGGAVVICADPEGIDAIVEDSIRHGVTMLCATPSLVRYCNTQADRFTDLRFIASGGDVLRREDADRLVAQGIEVTNSFGPTETTVTATSHSARVGEDPIPVGRPLANTRAFVLDRHREPTPVGVPGELYIGGSGVGRGYLNRPDLTAERFLLWRGERIYRTGDRARWLAGGTLAFVGRMDRQVKVRGFRVELGEIEAAISRHGAVDQVVVLTHADADGQKRLVAYVAPVIDEAARPGAEPAPGIDGALPTALREHLRQRLPGYMMPSAFVVLNTLPLTPTGKLDRKALPAPQEVEAPPSLHRPRSVTEQDLLAIWRDVLQNGAVGIYDNFFELGGHSLLAIRLASRIADAFGTALPPQALFRFPSVAELAGYLAQANPDLPWSTLVALQPRGDKAALFCVPGGGGNVFYFYPLARALGPEQPFYGLESLGMDGKQPPHATVEAAAAHHIRQIRKRWPHGPYRLAGHSFGGLVAFEMAQQLCRAGETIAMLAVLDTLPPSMPIPPATEPELMITFEGLFAEEYGRPGSLTVARLDPLPPEQRLEALKQALERLGALPAGATVAQVRGLFQVFSTNYRTEYRPGDVIDLPLDLLLAEESSAEERARIIEGWSRLATPKARIVPGSHTTMTYPPHVAELAAVLRDCLEG